MTYKDRERQRLLRWVVEEVHDQADGGRDRRRRSDTGERAQDDDGRLASREADAHGEETDPGQADDKSPLGAEHVAHSTGLGGKKIISKVRAGKETRRKGLTASSPAASVSV